jgi:hypothetical protein
VVEDGSLEPVFQNRAERFGKFNPRKVGILNTTTSSYNEIMNGAERVVCCLCWDAKIGQLITGGFDQSGFDVSSQ